jgi:hypothetical protein
MPDNDLLDACKTVLNEGLTFKALEKIIKAIDKAEGK